jgi:hypothetical protein
MSAGEEEMEGLESLNVISAEPNAQSGASIFVAPEDVLLTAEQSLALGMRHMSMSNTTTPRRRTL